MELAATLAACRSAEKAWLSLSAIARLPCTVPAARYLQPLSLHPGPCSSPPPLPPWVPNEDPGCASLGCCFLGVHVGQGTGLASLGL